MNLNDRAISAIRTFVPIAVGALLSYVAARWGIRPGAEVTTGLVVVLTACLSALYYAAVRVLERRWPRLGVLLGAAKEPTYPKEIKP